MLKFFSGDKNNMPVEIIIGKDIKPAGGIYLTKEILEEFQKNFGENVIVKQNGMIKWNICLKKIY